MSLAQLNRQRGTLLTKLKKLEKFVNDFHLNEHDNDEANFVTLNIKLSNLKDITSGCADLLLSYSKLPDDVDLQKDLDMTIDLEEQAQTLEVRLQLLINKFKANSSSKISMPIKLPDLPLPTFSGKFQDFEIFKKQFFNVVGKNPCLDDDQKLCYLRSSLKNEAARIQSEQDTFDSLWNALESRFENKRALVNIHITEILNIKKINSEDPVLLRSMIDSVRSNIRALNNMNMDSNNLSDAIFLHILNSKLDKETQKQFQLSLKSTEVPRLKQFLCFVEIRCSQLEAVGKQDFPDVKHQNYYSLNKPPRAYSPPKVFLSKSKEVKKCVMKNCYNSHPLYKCDAFKNLPLQQRRELVRNHQICERCLSYAHQTNCSSKFSCFLCEALEKDAYHNCLLCDNQNSPPVPRNGPDPLAPRTGDDAQSLTFMSSGKRSSRGVLNTAIVFVSSGGGRRTPLKCLLDSGSENSFLTDAAVDVLGLKRKKSDTTVLGLNNRASRISSVVNADISNSDQSYSFNSNFFVIPEIIQLHPSKEIDVSNLRIPFGCVLADPDFNIPSEISCLLGSEFFFDIIGPSQIKLQDSSFKLVESKFGFVMAGSYFDNPDSNFCLHSRGFEKLEKIHIFPLGNRRRRRWQARKRTETL